MSLSSEYNFKSEEADIGYKSEETKQNFIKNKKVIINFVIQHLPRSDIDLSKFRIPSYLDMDREENEEKIKCK